MDYQGHPSQESTFQSLFSGYKPEHQEPTYLFTKWKFSVYVRICQHNNMPTEIVESEVSAA